MIRVSLSLVALGLLLSCGPTMPPKCQPSNCSGCCTEAGECLGVMKQNRTTCGTGGITCLVCANGQTCSAQGRCVADTSGTGGGSATGGGTSGTGGGGAAVCGGEGEVCCANQMCNSSFSCSRGLCIRCGQTNQPCCSGNCLGSNICTNGTCVFPSGTGGGSATGGGVATGGGTAGGLATGGGVVTAGGSATGGGLATGGGTASAGGSATGGGTALLAIGDPCILSTECADGLCLTALFDSGYCSKTCTSDTDCAFGSNCSRNPAGGPNVCLKRCTTAGTTTGCRPSYVCDKAGTSLLGVPVCTPACTSSSSCGAGAFDCDGRGFCCGASPYACCNNTQCQSGTCSAGYCTGSGTGGGSSGTGGGSSGTGGGSSGTGGGSSGTGGGTSGTGGGTTSGGAVGSTCSGQSGCAGDPLNKRCNPTWSGVPPWTGGYCTIGNCTTTGPAACPSGSSCALYSGSPNHCLANCDFATQTGCRTGYLCERGITADFYQGTCYPRCTTNSHCSGTGRCDTMTGSCCGNIGYKCCTTGTPCSQGTCRANLGDYCG